MNETGYFFNLTRFSVYAAIKAFTSLNGETLTVFEADT
jgi:hypothetical protein